MYVCEYCGKEHDGTYGSGRFCSPSCSRKYSNTFVDDDARKRQIKALNDPENRRKNVEARNKKKKKKKTYKNKKKKSSKIRSVYYGKKLPCSRMMIGEIGEYRTAEEFAKRGFFTYMPAFHDSPVDMIVDLDGNLKKIQVKSTTRSDGSASMFQVVSTNERYTGGIRKNYVKRYDENEIDYFALYDFINDDVFLMKNRDITTRDVTIRDTKPKNNIKKVKYKKDYQFDKILLDMLLEDVPEGFTVLRDKIIDDDDDD